MSRFCQNCGTENEDTVAYCKNCGSALAVVNQANMGAQPNMNMGAQPNMNMGAQPNMNMGGQPNMNMGVQPQMNNYGNPTGPALVANRNIIVSIILALVTCGIYSIYWFIVMTDDAKKVSNDNNGASGGLAFVLTLVTCGIYGIYWYYKQGQRLYQAGQMYGVDIKDNSILYLILGLFGFGIVSYALIQADLNKFSNGN